MKQTFDISVHWRFSGPRVRHHSVNSNGPGTLLGSAAPKFHGDRDRWNPEQLFIASLSQCHMLTYLYLAEQAEIHVLDYSDTATGTLITHPDGSGEFEQVMLQPHVTIGDASQLVAATALHNEVANYCFIERSIAVKVCHQADTTVR